MSGYGNLDELFQKEAFKNMDPQKIEMAKNMAQQMQGKSEMEALQLMMQMAQQMNPSGKRMSQTERAGMIEAMRSILPEQQQQKFDALIKMMEMMGK